MTKNIVKTRKPLDAAMLAGLMPGLGHLYCGEFRKGIIWMGVSMGFIVSSILCFIFSPSRTGVAWGLSLFAIDVILMIVCMVQSWYLAKHQDERYELKEYNRWYVYLILLFICTIGSAVGMAFVLRERVVMPFVVPGASMSPTILPGDRVIARVDEFLDRDPERGEVVVFRSLGDRRTFFIKRVVAVAGDTVEWRETGELLINGEVLAQEEVGGVLYEQNEGHRYRVQLTGVNGQGTAVVPPHHCYVLGDNRGKSRDSRSFGTVPYSSLFAVPFSVRLGVKAIDE